MQLPNDIFVFQGNLLQQSEEYPNEYLMYSLQTHAKN